MGRIGHRIVQRRTKDTHEGVSVQRRQVVRRLHRTNLRTNGVTVGFQMQIEFRKMITRRALFEQRRQFGTTTFDLQHVIGDFLQRLEIFVQRVDFLNDTEDKVFEKDIAPSGTIEQPKQIHHGEVGVFVNVQVEKREDGGTPVNQIL